MSLYSDIRIQVCLFWLTELLDSNKIKKQYREKKGRTIYYSVE